MIAEPGKLRFLCMSLKKRSGEKRKLFDGDQDQFIQATWKAECCNCGQIIHFGVSDCQSFLKLDPGLRGNVLAEAKGIESRALGDTTFYKSDELPISYFQKSCPGCGTANLGILGLGEYQPARYMVVMLAFMVPDL